MITRRTVVDRIELCRDGSTQIRFALLLEEDGVEIDSKWHRTVVPPGGNVDAQIAAVDAHLQVMGHPPIETDLLNDVKAIADLGLKRGRPNRAKQ